MQAYEVLWLSGLLVAVSGLFFIAGYFELKCAIRIMENLSDKCEGTDTD